MRIFLTCDPEIPVPPVNYGGIERIVDALVYSYTDFGHEVYLVANPESASAKAVKIYGWPVSHSRGVISIIRNGLFLSQLVRHIKPDVVHSFSRLMYLYPTLLSSNISVLQTYQRKISNRSTSLVNRLANNRITFTGCAAYMFDKLAVRNKCSAVYNFTNTTYFTFNPVVKPKHLLFLGRIEEIKGTKECIEVALATNTQLIIAGNIQPGHDEYFNIYIKPHLNNPLIRYVGPVNDEQKRTYLQGAKAFLFPIKWEEPFGIVMAEAMACGVPVIGFRRGSVPEVVTDGKTGFIVDTVEQMIEGVNKIERIDRNLVREDCVKRFSQEVIAKQYLELLTEMVQK